MSFKKKDDGDIIEYSKTRVFEKFVGMKALLLTRKQLVNKVPPIR